MRRILTSALTVLIAAAMPAAAHAQSPQIPRLPASSSADIQGEINHRVEDARAQVEDFSSRAFPHNAPAKKAPAAPAPKKPQPRTNGGVDCANCVAITYDDGPGAETNRLLDKLKAKKAHASFMVLAPNAEQHPELLKRMKAEGHTIGNHTKSHRQLNTLSYDQVSQEIDAGNAAIKKATGQGTRWVRPPYGATNATVDQATRDKGAVGRRHRGLEGPQLRPRLLRGRARRPRRFHCFDARYPPHHRGRRRLRYRRPAREGPRARELGSPPAHPCGR